MKIPLIKQRDEDACGPTCIEMVLTYFEIPHTSKEVAKVTNYKKESGLYNTQLVAALKKFGLNVDTKTDATWEDLRVHNTKQHAVILSWMMEGYIGHFSVLEKVTKTHVYLAEPTTGSVLKMPKLQFLRLWFDYDPKWYPEKNTDIHLRWMAIVSNS